MTKYEKSDSSTTGKSNRQARDSVSGNLPSVKRDARPTVPRRRARLEAQHRKCLIEENEHLAKANEERAKAEEIKAELEKPLNPRGRPKKKQDGLVSKGRTNLLMRFSKTMKPYRSAKELAAISPSDRQPSLRSIAEKMDGSRGDCTESIRRALERAFSDARKDEAFAAERAGLPSRNRLLFAGLWIDKE
jgi:hypothetical protein